MTLGEKLQRLRKARGLTQEQLAEQVSVSRQSLSGWENDTALPDTAHVIALAELFGVTTDYLLRADESGPVQPAPSVTVSEEARPRWRMSARELGARLIVASAGVGLIVLRVLSSVYPAEVDITDELGRHVVYEGFYGFLQYYDLWWALYLLLAVLTLGLLQWFGPWLWQQGKRLVRWLRSDDGE